MKLKCKCGNVENISWSISGPNLIEIQIKQRCKKCKGLNTAIILFDEEGYKVNTVHDDMRYIG